MRTARFFKSKKVLVGEENVARPAILEVKDGKVSAILDHATLTPADETLDFGSHFILPGLVDTHAHINEPGRTEWEGFETATRAAASGGITTVIDMPLNSIPATTSLAALETKRRSAFEKCSIDYGFWGGVVPGNENELQKMIDTGIIGFKCFLIESGVEEFKWVKREDLKKAMPVLARNGIPLIVHAELDLPIPGAKPVDQSYPSYLESRPQSWEVEAIRMMIDLCRETGCRTHIVHLSASDALGLIREAKNEGLPFTVETCPHYLFFDAEHIQKGETHFKCAPPIREKSNQEKLWKAVKDGTIDFIVSDHSPCTPALKCLESGDFEKAWGGIAGLQFSFQAILTAGLNHGLTIEECNRKMSLTTARFVGLSSKGKLALGSDADFFVFDPETAQIVTPEIVRHRHKVTPYTGHELRGKILETYLRGKKIESTPFGVEVKRELKRQESERE